MSWWGWYLVGVFTIPVLAYLVLAFLWAFTKRYGIECDHCDKPLGVIGKNWQITTEIRWKIHYLRYWYRSRPNWTCKKETDHETA